MSTSVDRTHVSARARRAQQADLFRVLVEQVVDYAIFALTPTGHIASWNAGAQRLKGYTADEIIGSSFERFYTPEDRAAGRPQRLLGIARTEGRVEDEGWRVRKDGSHFWADVVITALRDDAGRLVGFAKVTRDLTERRQSEAERARRAAAERAAGRVNRLQAATAALAAVSRPAQVADVLASEGVAAVGALAGLVALVTPDGAGLEVKSATGERPALLDVHQVIGADAPDALAQAWQTGRPVFAATAERFVAAIPLQVERHTLGVISMSFPAERVLDEDERGVLLAMGEVGAQAIERARLYEAEQHARAEAEAAVHAQNEFLSIASHELRTPVAAVKATAQLAQRALERGQVEPPRTVRYLASIARAADRLSTLVEDLLDVSRLRTGQLRLRRITLDLQPLVHELVTRSSSMAAGHELRLRAPAERLLVYADPVRIEQVIENLLSNAIKYSPAGGQIEVGLQPADDGVSLEVTDHGIGLPAGEEGRIFETFGRASNAADQQIPGLGLGLSICRQLVEAHGGRIWATSPGEQQGTTVGVWLPRADSVSVADLAGGVAHG